jgi:hypothetical protein
LARAAARQNLPPDQRFFGKIVEHRQILNALGPFFGLILVIGFFHHPEVRPYFLTGRTSAHFSTVIAATGAGHDHDHCQRRDRLSVGSVVALTVSARPCSLKAPLTAALVTILAVRHWFDQRHDHPDFA